MPFNALYNVVNDAVFSKSGLPVTVSLTKNIHSEGKEYFLFGLPVAGTTVIGDFTLNTHHLSVYERALTSVDKSQHHYTAFFTDKLGKQYRLHVYFDSKDYYLWEPQFSVMVSYNKFEVINNKEHDEAFKTLAYLSTNSLIEHLRSVQDSVITKFQKEYDGLETRAVILSKNLVSNRKEYLAIIDRQIKIQEELKKYSNNTKLIFSRIKFLKNVYHNILAKKTEPSRLRLEVDMEESLQPEVVSGPEYKSSGYEIQENKSEELPKKSTVIDAIGDLTKRFLKCKSATVDQKIDLIVTCLSDLIPLELETNGLPELDLLRQDIEEIGKGLLQTLLISAQYDKATQLKLFFHLLGDNIFNLAIQRSVTDTHLLDFLLKNQIIPTNYKNFPIKSVIYSSVVGYYFESAIPVQAKINGLNTLIKNGVSLMALDKTGLPFAATLLFQPSHPLRSLLESNADLTLNNPLFYKQLNGVLLVLAAQLDCSKERQAEIKQLIDSNNILLDEVNSRKTIIKLSHIPPSKQKNTPLESSKANELIAKLRVDPEISALNRKIQHTTAVLLKKLRKEKASTLQSIGNISQVNLDTYKKALVDMEESELPTFDKLKELFHNQQKNVIEYLDLRFEFLNIKKSTHRGMSAKQSKAKKVEILDISTRLKKVDEQLASPLVSLLKAKIETKSKIIKGMDSLSNKIIVLKKQQSELEANLTKIRLERETILEKIKLYDKSLAAHSGFFAPKLVSDDKSELTLSGQQSTLSESLT